MRTDMKRRPEFLTLGILSALALAACESQPVESQPVELDAGGTGGESSAGGTGGEASGGEASGGDASGGDASGGDANAGGNGGEEVVPDEPERCSDADPELDADTDGDGLTDCRELEIGTAPHLTDTDGDGFSDFREVVELGFSAENNNFKFNPRIADTPRVHVNITSAPRLAAYFKTATGVEKVHEVERTTESSREVTTGSSSSNSHAVEFTVTAGGSVTVGAEAGFPSGGKASTEATVSYESSLSTSRETSFSWSEEQSQENSEGLAVADALATSESTTVDGGLVALTVDIENAGDVAFTLSNLAVSAYMSTPGNDTILTPVGGLAYDDTQVHFPEFTYGPGQKNGPFVFINDGLDTGLIRALLDDSTNLHVRVVAYELTDPDGRSFTHNQTEVQARTATIIVDYDMAGSLLSSERYQVATNTDPQTLRITTQQAMTQILGIPHETDADGQLIGVRDVATSVERNGYWFTALASTDGLVDSVQLMGPEFDPHDFGKLELKSGDVLHLVYVEDFDRDGLGRRQELAYGTAIDLADTDSDTISDGDEVTVYKTSPTQADTDGDGLDDWAELDTHGSDPLDADTDDDGLNDFDEITLGTDFADPDTDDDCLSDYEEIVGTETDPLTEQRGICDPIADPITRSWGARHVTYSNIRLGGVQQTLFVAKPGEVFNFKTDWSGSTDDDGSAYCPGCVVQLYLGIHKNFSHCFDDRFPFPGYSENGAISRNVTAPATPGVYYINQQTSLQKDCVSVSHADTIGGAVATIVVTESEVALP